jgi:hypothetical protein
MATPHETTPDACDEELRRALATHLSQTTISRLGQVVAHTGLSIREILAQAIDAAWSVEFDEQLTRYLTLLDDES